MKQRSKIILSAITFTALVASIFYFQGKFFTYRGNDFRIPSTKGIYQLSNDRGKVVVLYFGYRFCPDVCPTTLSELASIRKKLTPDEKELFQVVFISLDPDRDTIKELKEYVKFFHPSFIGATSSRKELDIISNYYGVSYKINKPLDKEETYYTVDHSVAAFIIGKDGKQKDIFLYGEKGKENLNKIRKYIKEEI